MTLPANIRVNVRVPFPALVQGGAFVAVNKANGIWTVAPNYQLLAEAMSVTPTQIIAVYDTASGVWSYVAASDLATGGSIALSSLSDVQVTEGSAINGDALTWNQSLGKWVAASGTTIPVTTVAGLATAFPTPMVGQRGYVTDAVSMVFGAGLTGGGSTKGPVNYNGTAWIAG